MNVNVQTADVYQKKVLKNLVQLYKYDFTEFDPEDVNDDGEYECPYFDEYWTEASRFPFLFKVEDNYAGFALIRKINDSLKGQSYYSVAEFFVMKKYRKSGVGKQAACYLFDVLPGRWQVSEMEENEPAIKFWRKIINEYTNGQFTEIDREDWEGPTQTFQSGS